MSVSDLPHHSLAKMAAETTAQGPGIDEQAKSYFSKLYDDHDPNNPETTAIRYAELYDEMFPTVRVVGSVKCIHCKSPLIPSVVYNRAADEGGCASMICPKGHANPMGK